MPALLTYLLSERKKFKIDKLKGNHWFFLCVASGMARMQKKARTSQNTTKLASDVMSFGSKVFWERRANLLSLLENW